MSIRDEAENLTNQELIQNAKDNNGAVYHRINSLQRDLNIANAEVERLKNSLHQFGEMVHSCQYKVKYDNLRQNLSAAYEHLLNKT